MWGRAPWAGSSLLINQCKNCGDPGRSPHSAWLTPGGFDLEMEKIWILLVPPPVRWTQNNQAFFKVYFKMLQTNHADAQAHNMVSTSKPHGIIFRIVLWGWAWKTKKGKRERERGRKREGWLVKKAFSEQEIKTPAQVCCLLVSCAQAADEELSRSSRALKHHMHAKFQFCI